MKILIGADVDPILPAILYDRPQGDIWTSLNQISRLIERMGNTLPPITWLIRADETVRFSTGMYDSGFTSHQDLWAMLTDQGHEMGWHMHNLSFNRDRGCFIFDLQPSWLSVAHDSLSVHFPVRASRSGWDYGNAELFASLNDLGIQIDFSALPGSLAWHRAGPDWVAVDWRRCDPTPYHPDRNDYQSGGANKLDMLEIPITQFPNTLTGVAKRCVNRISHRCFSASGLRYKTLRMTDAWPHLPSARSEILAFFFHPEELTEIGIAHFVHNVQQLRQMRGAEFMTASDIAHVVHSASRQSNRLQALDGCAGA